MKMPEKRSDTPQTCPGCGADVCWRDGRTLAGRQRWRCKKCGRRFGESDLERATARRIAGRLLEIGLPTSGIARAMRGYVSERWLYLRKQGMRHDQG